MLADNFEQFFKACGVRDVPEFVPYKKGLKCSFPKKTIEVLRLAIKGVGYLINAVTVESTNKIELNLRMLVEGKWYRERITIIDIDNTVVYIEPYAVEAYSPDRGFYLREVE